MFIIVDDESRENEGDLVIPAQFADANAINFMARHGRGLICLALPRQRVRQLGLSLMAGANESRLGTAFTTSIEATKGVTTGISAADRATTIAAAIGDEANSTSITSPGHVFPLEAKQGGVLVRAGHTEAALDIATAAGLKPYGVICEIMNDDGTMARMPDLKKFATKHRLKIATIAQLIEWRLSGERLVAQTFSRKFKGYGGEFQLYGYKTTLGDGGEHLALVKGKITAKPTLVRVQTIDPLGDALGGRNTLQVAMEKIAHRNGVLVIIDKLGGMANAQASTLTPALKEYGIGAQILRDLGVTKMILLSTHTPPSIAALEGYGLSVAGNEKL